MKPVVALDIDGTLGGMPCLVDTTTRQSRKAWIKANGPVPEGMQVLHRCDNPLCRRVSHLFLGTAKDNTQDMIAKGRRYTTPRKVTAEIIQRWRSGERAIDLAKEIGCHPMAISWAARHREGERNADS